MFTTTKHLCALVSACLLSTFVVQAEIKEVTLPHTNNIESVYEPLQAVWRDDIALMDGSRLLKPSLEPVSRY